MIGLNVSLENPNKAEREWMDAITRIGCIVCYLQGHPGTPGVVHHILSQGRTRMGHLFTICLCDPGHHQNGDGINKISRHPWRTRFVKEYGTEMYLLEETGKLVRAQCG